ncbi:hypothetical protein IAT38_007719 [Cryptococcus sp. DSM 104549]
MLPFLLLALGLLTTTIHSQSLEDPAELRPVFLTCVNKDLIYGYNTDTTTPGLLIVPSSVGETTPCSEACFRSEYSYAYSQPEMGLCYCTLSQLAGPQDVVTADNIQCTSTGASLMRMNYLQSTFTFRNCQSTTSDPLSPPDLTLTVPTFVDCVAACGPATNRQRLSVVTPLADEGTGEYSYRCECMDHLMQEEGACGVGTGHVYFVVRQ